MLTSKQLDRCQALARLVNDSEYSHLLREYRGDIVYDGAILANSDGPVILILRDCGSNCYPSDRIESAKSSLLAYGDQETDTSAALWFYGVESTGEWGHYTFRFVRMPAAEAIARMEQETACSAGA